MNFESAYEEFKIYAIKRHKKQGFITISQDFENHILPYFKNKNLIELDKLDFINWQNNILDKNFSNKYNSKIYYAFNSFLKYCLMMSYISVNYLSLVGPFVKKIEYKKYDVYTIKEFRKFRHYLKNNVYKQFFNFMFFYGTRPSETMALRFSDLSGHYVHINHNLQRKGKRELDTPKNQSSIRSFKISYLMLFRIFILKRYYIKNFGFCNDYYIFGGLKPLSPTSIDRYKLVACKKAKLRPITQHQFRHSFATRMIHKKVPIDFVSRCMGHSKVSTTLDIYLHQEKNAFQHF